MKVQLVSSKNLINVHISPDDHVSLVVQKVASVLNIPPDKLYLWVKQKIQKNPIIIINFINQLFGGSSLIDANTFIRSCAYYFGLEGSSPDTTMDFNMITKSLAFKTLSRLNITHIIRPLTHFYTNGGYLMYLPYDPRTVFRDDNPHERIMSAALQNNENLIIDHVIDPTTSNLYVATTSDIPEKFHSFYFPFKDARKIDFEGIRKFTAYITDIEEEFAKPISKPFSTNHFINILQLKSFKIPRITTNRIDLAVLFNAFETSSNVPFIKFKAMTNIYHKVYKKFIIDSSNDIRGFDKWYNSTFKLQDSTYIIFKVKVDDNNYMSIILNDTLEFDIRTAFGMKDQRSLDSISKIFEKGNLVITRIRDILKEDTIPLLPKNLTTNDQDVWEIQRLVSYHVANLGFKANKENAEKFVANKLFPYFDVIPDIGNLRLQYKKVSNYNKVEQIAAFISKNRNLEESALIERISANFSISIEDASRELENWQLYHSEETAVFVKYDQYVEVLIQFNSPIDVKYIITGASSVSMIHRISKLISFILAASERKIEVSKMGSNVKEIYLQQIDNPKVSPARATVEDDDDWLAELRELETEHTKDGEPEDITIPNERPSSLLALGDDKKLKGFVKRMLDHADPALFNYKSESKKRGDYASICGWVDRRQPVVITEDEKKVIDEKYPGAYKGFVKSGSTIELEKRHYYICPKIWCPRSRVAVPPGTECPGENEDPIVFESKTYWGLGEQAMNRDHYPGYLDKYTRADGLCLPCCFKLQPKEGNRNKKRQEQCVPLSQEEVLPEDETAIGTEKYIKADTYFPLEVGRLGLISKKLHQFLGKPNAGSRHNGTGLMTDKTETYLRKGIAHGNQSFINCIITTLDNPKIKTSNDFVKIITKYLDIFSFMTLENGKVLQLFIDHGKSPYNSVDFTVFRKWFLSPKTVPYISQFNLLKIKKELEVHEVFTKAIRYYKDILREFIIYFSYQNFIKYMNDAKLEKDHRILLDLINISSDWLNIREYNYIVIDVDVITGEVYIDCPMNRDANRFVNKLRPFIFIIKQNKYYEPLYYVKNMPSDQLVMEYRFSIDDVLHSRIKDIINFYFNNCSTSKFSKDDERIAFFLESNGYKPKFYVVDYDFRMCGLILQNNLYVPFVQKKDSFGVKGMKFVYISDVVLFKCLEDMKEIKRVFQLLSREFGSEYYGIDFIIKGDMGIVLNSGKFIPLKVHTTASVAQKYLDDLYIFTGIQEADERTEFIKEIISKENTLDGFIKHVNKLDEDEKLEIMFLKDKSNPLPIEFKREKLTQLLSKTLKGSTPHMVEVADRILNYFFDVQQKQVKHFHVTPDELFFDYQDIQEGRMTDIIERARNPYKLIINNMDNIFDKYVFEEDASQEHVVLIPEGAEFFEMPAKFGNIQYRKLLKGFSVVFPAVPDLFNYFIKVKKAGGGETMTRDDLLGIIKTNVKKDYAQKTERLQDLYDNPSFKAHIKTMKLKQNTITLDHIMSILSSVLYKPSFVEVRILARIANVNIIIIGRKNLKNPDGLFQVVYVKSPHYIFFVHSFDRKEGIDKYNIVVKDQEKVLLSKNDLPTELIEMVNTYLGREEK